MDITFFKDNRNNIKQKHIDAFTAQFIKLNNIFDLLNMDNQQIIEINCSADEYPKEVLNSMIYIKDQVCQVLIKHFMLKGYGNINIDLTIERNKTTVVIQFELGNCIPFIYNQYKMYNAESTIPRYLFTRLKVLIEEDKVVRSKYCYTINLTKRDTPKVVWKVLTSDVCLFQKILQNALEINGFDSSVYTKRADIQTEPLTYVVEIYLTISE